MALKDRLALRVALTTSLSQKIVKESGFASKVFPAEKKVLVGRFWSRSQRFSIYCVGVVLLSYVYYLSTKVRWEKTDEREQLTEITSYLEHGSIYLKYNCDDVYYTTYSVPYNECSVEQSISWLLERALNISSYGSQDIQI